MPKHKLLTPPTIILVRPQMGENIGAAARAMSNFGLTDLRLVAPRDGWPNDAAKRVAAGGEAIIEQAALFDTTAEALADMQLAFATTARSRDIAKPVLTPQEVISQIIAAIKNITPHPNPPPQGGREQEGGQQADPALSPSHGECSSIRRGQSKTALLFGPERTGLENEDIALCDALVTIPTLPDHFSLNLGQSVLVLAYEWFTQSNQWPVTGDQNNKQEAQSVDRASPEAVSCDLQEQIAETHHIAATKEEYQGLFDQLEAYLDDANFFRVPEKKPVMWNNTRAMLLRGRFSSQEIQTLRGMLRVLWEGRQPGKKTGS